MSGPRLRVANPVVALGLVVLAVLLAVGAGWWLMREIGPRGATAGCS